jgi:uncharacterized lipoprotein YajG
MGQVNKNWSHQIMRYRPSLTLLLPLLAVVVIAAGCAWVPQNARLKVAPTVAPSEQGRGVTIAIEVLDRRMTTTIGRRGVDSEDAPITTKQNLSVLVRNALIAGYAKKGFNAIPHEGEPGRVLTVELNTLAYTTDMDFWKGIVMTEAVLTASIVKSGVRFEQVYAGRRKETTIEAPRARTNERLLNEALAEAVKGVIEDPRLLRFLAE